MAYPKTSAETKMKFIADVINQLEERGSTKEAECLRAKQNLDKQYESAQRYSRIMKEKDEEDAETSPTDQMPYEQPQEVEVYAPHVGYSSPYKNKQQSTVRKLTKERRKMLMEKHVDLLDWIQCVDDGIVKGNLDEAQRVIKMLDDYADRLQQLLSEKYFNRARTLLLQLKEIEKVIQTDEMDRIRQEVDSYATVNAV